MSANRLGIELEAPIAKNGNFRHDEFDLTGISGYLVRLWTFEVDGFGAKI
jgi:hypothetical protein